jgi:hypothetical protein
MVTMNTTMKRWKRFLNPNPTEQQFREAFKLLFKYYPEECVFHEIINDGINFGFNLQSPTTVHMNGGFGFHTDSPVLLDSKDEYYNGGCSWGIDNEGRRFYKLDYKTGLPVDWEEVRAKETIRSWMTATKFMITNIGTKAISQ